VRAGPFLSLHSRAHCSPGTHRTRASLPFSSLSCPPPPTPSPWCRPGRPRRRCSCPSTGSLGKTWRRRRPIGRRGWSSVCVSERGRKCVAWDGKKKEAPLNSLSLTSLPAASSSPPAEAGAGSTAAAAGAAATSSSACVLCVCMTGKRGRERGVRGLWVGVGAAAAALLLFSVSVSLSSLLPPLPGARPRLGLLSYAPALVCQDVALPSRRPRSPLPAHIFSMLSKNAPLRRQRRRPAAARRRAPSPRGEGQTGGPGPPPGWPGASWWGPIF